MKTRRISFEEWLKKQGVVEKRENTHKPGGISQEAGINYSFKNQGDAENFCSKYSVVAHSSRGEPAIFPDRFTDKPTIYISHDKHTELVKEYKAYLAQSNIHRPTHEIKAQINAIENRKKPSSNFGDRLDSLNKLATNQKTKGWISHEATSVFDISLRNYIALNQELFSKDELKSFNTTANLIMGPNADVYSGIKQDANWWDDVKNNNNREEQVIRPLVIIDTLHLLDGESHRRGIDKDTPQNASMTVTNDQMSQSKGKVKARKIKRFFPDENGNSETDVIYLDTGGQAAHRTITKIWKRGVDASGQLGLPVHHYEYFQTEYNAGSGSKVETASVLNPETKHKTNPIVWVVSTKKIEPHWKFDQPLSRDADNDLKGKSVHVDPNVNVDGYNEVMRDTIADLIISHRLVTLHHKKNNDNKENPEWKKWDERIQSHLDPPIVDDLSFKGVAQSSENCTVMSVKVLTDHENHSLSEEHWLHAKQYNGAGTRAALDNKLEELKVELQVSQKLEENADRIFDYIRGGNEEAVRSIIKTYPEIHPGILTTLDEENKQFKTPLLVAINSYTIQPNNDPTEQKRRNIIMHLIGEGGDQINLVVSNDNRTPLHQIVSALSSRYADTDTDKVRDMVSIAARLIAKGADLDAADNKNGVVIEEILNLPIEQLGQLVFKLLESPNPHQAAAATKIIARQPELAGVTDKNGNSLLFFALSQVKYFVTECAENDINKGKIDAYVKVACLLVEKYPRMLTLPNGNNLSPLDWLLEKQDDRTKSALKLLYDMPAFQAEVRAKEAKENEAKSTTDLLRKMSNGHPIPKKAPEPANLQELKQLADALEELQKTLAKVLVAVTKIEVAVEEESQFKFVKK